MFKESVIIFLILLLVILGNYITQKYTVETVNMVSEDLNQLRNKLENEDEKKENLYDIFNTVNDKWYSRHVVLANYIEHQELEKVETGLSSVKGYMDVNEYSDAIVEIDRINYMLKHIEHKNAINFENIF